MQTQKFLDDQRFLEIVPEPELREFIEANPQSLVSEALLRARDKLAYQKEYIELLSAELGKCAGFLFAHGITADNAAIERGEFLRGKIAN